MLTPLPKLTYPLYSTQLPSTSKLIKYRPMTVREEKILLTAAETREQDQIFAAIRQVVNNCLQEPATLAIFDVEYMFIKIRIVSVSNIVKVSYKDREDEKVYDFEIDLENVVMQHPTDPAKQIDIDGSTTMNIRYPSADLFEKVSTVVNTPADLLVASMCCCIDTIQQGSQKWSFDQYSLKEQMTFVEQLPSKGYQQLKTFFENSPSLYYKIEYKNSLDHNRSIELRTLTDFFTFA